MTINIGKEVPVQGKLVTFDDNGTPKVRFVPTQAIGKQGAFLSYITNEEGLFKNIRLVCDIVANAEIFTVLGDVFSANLGKAFGAAGAACSLPKGIREGAKVLEGVSARKWDVELVGNIGKFTGSVSAVVVYLQKIEAITVAADLLKRVSILKEAGGLVSDICAIYSHVVILPAKNLKECDVLLGADIQDKMNVAIKKEYQAGAFRVLSATLLHVTLLASAASIVAVSSGVIAAVATLYTGAIVVNHFATCARSDLRAEAQGLSNQLFEKALKDNALVA